MTPIKSFDMLPIKQVLKEKINHHEDHVDDNNSDSESSLLQPSLFDNKNLSCDGENDDDDDDAADNINDPDFLRLNSKVC